MKKQITHTENKGSEIYLSGNNVGHKTGESYRNIVSMSHAADVDSGKVTAMLNCQIENNAMVI